MLLQNLKKVLERDVNEDLSITTEQVAYTLIEATLFTLSFRPEFNVLLVSEILELSTKFLY